jgi:hypothetical protein
LKGITTTSLPRATECGLLMRCTVSVFHRTRFTSEFCHTIVVTNYPESGAEVADQYRDGYFKHPVDNGAVEMQVGIEIYGILGKRLNDS